MKSGSSLLAAACAALVLSIAGRSQAASTPAASTPTRPAPVMHHYLLVSPHTQEECLAALDAVAAMGATRLARWEFGCEAGDHTGYAFVSAASVEAARAMIPESLHEKAEVRPLTRFTLEQIKSFHEQVQPQEQPVTGEGK